VGGLLAIFIGDGARQLAGILLLSLVAVEWGGLFLYRVVGGRVGATEFQRAFFRAGHAHAGVLVVLALVANLYAEAADAEGPVEWIARTGIPVAAILMPAGFFLAASGRGRTEPNRFVVLLWLGAASLAAGVISLGLSLLL
jgi:hypothetical protein